MSNKILGTPTYICGVCGKTYHSLAGLEACQLLHDRQPSPLDPLPQKPTIEELLIKSLESLQATLAKMIQALESLANDASNIKIEISRQNSRISKLQEEIEQSKTRNL
jgi:hypothetical protein